MGKTKKVGSAARFKARFGRKVRIKLAKIEKLQKARYECPKCKLNYLVREASGIWVCKKCGAKIAGGAYIPYGELKV